MANFIKNEDGQGMVEYALILALVSVVAITVLTALGTKVSDEYQAAADALTAPAVEGA